MVPRENKNNAYAKFGCTNKNDYGIFESGQLLKVFDFKRSPCKLFKSISLEFPHVQHVRVLTFSGRPFGGGVAHRDRLN